MPSEKYFHRDYGIRKRSGERRERHSVLVVFFELLEFQIDSKAQGQLFRQHFVIGKEVVQMDFESCNVSVPKKVQSRDQCRFFFQEIGSFVERPSHQVSERFYHEMTGPSWNIFVSILEYRGTGYRGSGYDSSSAVGEFHYHVHFESAYRLLSGFLEEIVELGLGIESHLFHYRNDR